MVVLTDGKDHAGVKIVDKDGKTLAQFPLPIKGEVVPENGARGLLIK